MAYLVETMRYKPEGLGLDSRLGHWGVSFLYSFRPPYCPGVDSPSDRNEYQVYLLRSKGEQCVGLKNVPPCLEILGALNFWSSTGLSRLVWESFNFLPFNHTLAYILRYYTVSWGTAVAQWLRCCATNRKVAGSIPAGVSGF